MQLLGGAAYKQLDETKKNAVPNDGAPMTTSPPILVREAG